MSWYKSKVKVKLKNLNVKEYIAVEGSETELLAAVSGS